MTAGTHRHPPLPWMMTARRADHPEKVIGGEWCPDAASWHPGDLEQ